MHYKVKTDKIAFQIVFFRIHQEENNDYENLFALFTSTLPNSKLCQDEVSQLEHDLTKDKLLNALKGFKPGKTPGDDGFTK